LQADEGFGEGNLKHSINGYVFCNMPDVSLGVSTMHLCGMFLLHQHMTLITKANGFFDPQLKLQRGHTARMMLLGGGTENDMHSSVFRNQVGCSALVCSAVLCPLLLCPLLLSHSHLVYILINSHCSCCWMLHILHRSASLTFVRTNHMQVLTYDKARTSTTQLFPSVARTAELVASQPGIWQYNCDVQDHLVAGMSHSVHPVIVQRVCMLHFYTRCTSKRMRWV
jgi:FtsP/CotA-like multicopper oxidase with cupredoxin domain